MASGRQEAAPARTGVDMTLHPRSTHRTERLCEVRNVRVSGRCACLSSSFWWSNRWLVRHVQRSRSPNPRPIIYIDSGAAIRATEANPNLRDGFHHTRSMFRALSDHAYKPGIDMNWLVFTNAKHDAESWRARIAIPLQLLFPPKVRRPEAVKQERRARRRPA